jgi:hypothetical protein
MMPNGAGLVASPAHDHFNRRRSRWGSHHDRLRWYHLIKAVDAPTLQAVFVEVVQKRTKPFVFEEHDTRGIWCRLKGSPELEGDVKVQRVLAGALNFLEVDTAEPVSCGRLHAALRWVPVRAHIDDGFLARVQL